MNSTSEKRVFPGPVRRYALLGLFGLAVFVSSLVVVHLESTGFDWMRDYVSYMANAPLGSVFIAGAFVHGWGNLALTLGLRGALHPGRLRTLAVLLFGLAAVGIMLAPLFPIDPSGQTQSTTEYIHIVVASAAFVLELAAMFVFSIVFGRDRRWQRQQPVSLLLSVSGAIALMVFVIAIQVDIAPGLAERVAAAILLTWEVWVCFQLLRPA